MSNENDIADALFSERQARIQSDLARSEAQTALLERELNDRVTRWQHLEDRKQNVYDPTEAIDLTEKRQRVSYEYAQLKEGLEASQQETENLRRTSDNINNLDYSRLHNICNEKDRLFLQTFQSKLQDPATVRRLVSADEVTQRAGYTPGTNDYYAAIEERMGWSKEDRKFTFEDDHSESKDSPKQSKPEKQEGKELSAVVKIGYARTSTIEQIAGFEAQLRDLKAAGCDRIFQEQLSSVDAKRPQLEAAIDYCRDGDVLVCTKLDRLARSVADVVAIEAKLKAKGAALRVMDPAMDTSTPAGRLTFNVLASIAQFEREIMLTRQREGIAKAKSEGKYKGRKATAREQTDKILALHAANLKAPEIAAQLGISERSVYRVLAGTTKILKQAA